MDALDMWRDTMLVVTTDHGYLLGEHDWWAKNRMHVYQEIAHIPLFVHHPAFAGEAGARRAGLTQTMDLMPTFLEAHGLAAPEGVAGKSLLPMLADPARKLHDSVLYGHFGGSVNISDGRYTYFRYPVSMQEQELYQYTLMPTHMLQFFTAEEMAKASMDQGSAFTHGMPVMKVPVTAASPWWRSHGPAKMTDTRTVLFDLAADPEQLHPLEDPAIEAAMLLKLVARLKEADAPAEVYRRFDLKTT
jgi:arylsulfatase A-like enzyme